MYLTEYLQERSRTRHDFFRDILYVPEIGLVSTFVSKNASSFLKTYLSCLARGKAFSPPMKNPHMPDNMGFKGLEHLGHKRMSELLEDPGVIKTVVGRHPIDRLISAWKTRVDSFHAETYDLGIPFDWLLVRQAVLGSRENRWAVSTTEGLRNSIDWDSLFKHVLATPSALLDRHLIPQTYFAATDRIDYSLVGTVETLDLYLDRLSQELNVPRLLTEGIRVNGSSGLRALEVDSDTEAALFRRYRADFSFFGYSLGAE